MKNFLEYFGWYGVGAILLAYMISSFNIVSTNNIVYLMLNATGSAGIAIISYKKGAMQSVVINLIWLVITLIALGNLK